MYQKRKSIETMLIWTLDIVCILCSCAAAFWIRFERFYGAVSHWDQIWQISFMIFIYIMINVFVDFNHHFFRRGSFEELVSVVQMEAIFAICWVVLLFILHRTEDLSRLVFGYFIVINLILTYGVRTGFKQYMVQIYKHGRYSSRMLLVTDSQMAGDVISNLIEYKEWNRILKGIVFLDKEVDEESFMGYPIVASQDTLLNYVIHND